MEEREYTPNSHKYKEEQKKAETQKKRVGKLVTGNVKTKKNEVRKLTDVFISEDVSNVKSYVLMEVLVPAIKKAISDIVTNGVDMILYGGTRPNKNRTSSDYVSYRNYSDRDRRDDRGPTRGRGFDYEDLVFDSRGDAEAVRQGMLETIDQYGIVTVGDLYDMADRTAPYTSYDYGWTSIRTAEVVRVRDGFIIKLPRAVPLD